MNFPKPSPIASLTGQIKNNYHKLEALGPDGVLVAKGLYVATCVMWGILKIEDHYAADRDRLITGLINLAPSNKTVGDRIGKVVKKRG